MTETEYERERAENIRKNNEVLRKLGLEPMPLPANQSSNTAKRKRPPPKRKQSETHLDPPQRVSLRIRGQKPEVGKDFSEDHANGTVKSENSTRYIRLEGTLDLQQENIAQLKNISSNEKGNIAKKETEIAFSDGMLKNINNPISGGTVKVTKDMIFSIAMHPSESKLICGAGDKQGNLVFWDIDDSLNRSKEDDFEPIIIEFRPHLKPISKIIYDPKDSNSIWTSSYDSSIRRMDIIAGKSMEMYVAPGKSDWGITHFDLRQNSCWFCNGEGEAGTFDSRGPTKDTQIYAISGKKVNTIHINPESPEYFVTAGLDRSIKIFDIRNMKVNDDDLVQPICEMTHNLSVNSAYWNPKGREKLNIRRIYSFCFF